MIYSIKQKAGEADERIAFQNFGSINLHVADHNALYKQMGMGKKAQGIAFSLPVSDVAGLVKLPEEEK